MYIKENQNNKTPDIIINTGLRIHSPASTIVGKIPYVKWYHETYEGTRYYDYHSLLFYI
jgi:hypothetical protein